VHYTYQISWSQNSSNSKLGEQILEVKESDLTRRECNLSLN